MLIQGQVGQINALDGVQNNIRQGRTGELILSQAHARFYEQASRGSLYTLTTLATTTGIAAGNLVGAAANAATQFAIWNPVGSGINMNIQKVFVAMISGTPPGGPIFHGVFLYGNPTNLSTFDTGRGALNNLIGGKSPVCRYINTAAQSGTTITGGTAPAVLKAMTIDFSASSYANAGGANCLDLVEGDIVIPPGYGWLPLWASAGTSVLNSYSVTWEEVPI